MIARKTDIQYILEETFDIPFIVQSGFSGRDPWYIIGPSCQNKELFEIKLSFRNHIRLIIEFIPGAYSAALINDMATANEERKLMFARYAEVLESKRVKIEFIINHHIINPRDPLSWPVQWNQISFKVTRSPVIAEDEDFNPEKLVAEWSTLIIGMILSLVDVVTIEEPLQARTEGAIRQITTDRYERSPVNRELCLAANGYECHVCGIRFEHVYGEIGYKFIHVHHITPVSQMGESYIIDPVADLVPVCPNCHAMLHKKDPPYDVEELFEILESHRKNSPSDQV